MTKPRPQPDPDGPLARVLPMMCCPVCRAELRREGDTLACTAGTHTFPMHDGIPLLAIQGTTETWSGESPSETSAGYQEAYQELEAARHYNEAYRDQATKRWSTRREFTLLERHLASQPRSDTLLDLPSGGGRLSEQLARHTDFLVEADIGLGQLLYAKGEHDGTPDRVWMTASGFHIPFRDEGVDAVVCCRLCHHLPTAVERERLLAELLRVARRFVVMTFFDHYSVKNWLRRARRPFDGKPPKMTMTVGRVRELAEEHGAELVAQPPLSRAFSGHRYALLVKR